MLMKKKTRRRFLRRAGVGCTVLAGFGLASGAAAAGKSCTERGHAGDATGDWPTFHGAPTRSGYSSASGPVADPTASRFRTSSPSTASNLAVADGVVYFVQDSHRPTLVAFDPESESTLWTTHVTPGSSAGVSVEEGTVYVVGGSQQAPECVLVPPTLAAVDAGDGTIEWEHAFDPVTVTWPTVADGETYVVADDEAVAIDAGGSVSWRTPLADGTDGDRSAIPALADGVVVVAAADGVVALDASDGSEAWRYDLPDAADATVADGTVYATGRTGVVALELSDGTERWRFDGAATTGAAAPSAAPAVGDGRVYVPMDEEYVEAVSTADGESAWRSDRLGDVSVAVGGETVYAAVSEPASRQLGVFALAAPDGERRWEYEPETPFSVESPAIADGSLLFGGNGLTVLTGE